VKAHLREILITLLVVLLLYLGLQALFQSFRVEGGSMNPSFHNGQFLMVNKALYHFHSPQRGDVIVFHPPINPDQAYIKRVIGLPGDRVEIREGKVYIDGKLLKEEPVMESIPGSYPGMKIPEGEYFVLGDNRDNSNDSRKGWTVPKENIIGKVWFCYWPPREWGLSPSYSAAIAGQ
jgi:signal peptidase I